MGVKGCLVILLTYFDQNSNIIVNFQSIRDTFFIFQSIVEVRKYKIGTRKVLKLKLINVGVL